MAITIRAARPSDALSLRSLELAAGEQFRAVGLGTIADDPPPAIETFRRYAERGLAWVAESGTGTIIGFVLASVVDDEGHLDQMSVHPDHQGKGTGRLLFDAVREWTGATGLGAITFTTFTTVPWNRPLYEHLGFEVVPDEAMGAELRAIRAAETERGIDVLPRVAMIYRLTR